MANTKISALPTYSGTPAGTYAVIDDSGLTQTYKVTYETFIGKASGIVNAGVDVTLGNLKARIPTSGNRSLQLSTAQSGTTYSVFGSGIYGAGGVGYEFIDGVTPLTITTTPTYLRAATNFNAAGQTDTWLIMDAGNNISWRISLIVGVSFNNNMITIERLT
jgi:hypothetical protein